jgi:hypothetical protein
MKTGHDPSTDDDVNLSQSLTRSAALLANQEPPVIAWELALAARLLSSTLIVGPDTGTSLSPAFCWPGIIDDGDDPRRAEEVI